MDDWRDLAECRGVDPDLFFPTRGESIATARATCAACPVRTECLEYAIEHREKFGIWGGLSERERRRIRRDRRRQPNATEAAPAGGSRPDPSEVPRCEPLPNLPEPAARTS